MKAFSTLFLLWRLEFRGRIRWLLKQVRRPAGAIMLVFWCLMCGSWVTQFLFTATVPNVSQEFSSYMWMLEEAVPAIMAMVAVLAIFFPADMSLLLFRPVETDILFAGPFSRRQILAFKLASQTISIVAGALFFSLFTVHLLPLWFASFATMFLVLHFVRIFPLAYTLFLKAIQQRGARRAGRLVPHASRILTGTIRIGVCVLLVLAIHAFYYRARGLFSDNANANPEDLLAFLKQDPFLNAIVWPFQSYGHLLVSARLFPDMLQWLAIAGSINLALVLSILFFDADYMESELANTQRNYARLQQVRRGQLIAPKAKQWGRIRSLPDFPRLHGAGAIAWRQTTGAMRSFPTVMVLFPVLSIAAGIGFNISGLGEAGNTGIGVIVCIALYATLLYASMAQRSFRADLDFMDTLKAMPAQSKAIVIGESFAPVAQFTYLHLSASFAIIIGFEKPLFWLSVLLIAPPLNAVLALSQNLGFLLLPARATVGHSGDLVSAGKQMISFMAVGLIFVACLAASSTVGGIVWFVFGYSPWAAQLGAALGLYICAAVLVPLTASAFDNFDFSADMPG